MLISDLGGKKCVIIVPSKDNYGLTLNKRDLPYISKYKATFR